MSLSTRFGVRFPCMSDAYDRELQQLAMDVGQELGYGDFLKEGVYCVLGGPSFETIAECRMLHRLGADAVGESQQECRRSFTLEESKVTWYPNPVSFCSSFLQA